VKDAFLEERHHRLAERFDAFAARAAGDEGSAEARTRALVRAMGAAGLLDFAVPPPAGSMDLRSLVIARERLAHGSSLADTAFAMQGLGSYPISLAGTDAQRQRWLPAVVRGEVLCAFALTEPEAGSDLSGIRTRAARDGAGWRMTGLKTLISNAGIAGLITVLARTAEGKDGLSMFLVAADAAGLSARPLEAMADHPLGELSFEATPAELLGGEGEGLRIALATLEVFRPSVGAAACGLAGRALDEAVRWSRTRRQFGRPLADLQATQLALAEMHTELAAARLLVYHAAWLKDCGQERITAEAAAAKLAATEAAQRVVDRAVQIHGGQGVLRGSVVERLYREVRSLRIYEGTSEVQKLIIARELLKQ
jgi:acyl-CoA dehydrogenase